MEISPSFHSLFNEKYSIESRKMVRALSENSRVSISSLAQFSGLSRVTVLKKLRQLESALGIKYVLELDEAKLGLVSPHLVTAKFAKKPSYEEIARLLSSSYIPQVAVATKGHYDLIIYATSPSSGEYARWDKSMQILLSKYGVTWRSSWVVHRQLGFFPLRNELLERLPISQKYKPLLELLNSNARLSFSEISRRLGMHFNTVAYNFRKLMLSGYVVRPTIVMQPRPELTFMSFFTKYSPSEGYEESSAQARKAFMSDDPYSLISRYLVCAPLIGSYDFFTLGVFDNFKTALRQDVQYHKRLFVKHKIRMEYAVVDKVLLGYLPIRSIDTAKEYKLIKWTVEPAAT